MTHAEICPCCGGSGKKWQPIPTSDCSSELCNCCGGSGWVEVSDQAYVFPSDTDKK